MRNIPLKKEEKKAVHRAFGSHPLYATLHKALNPLRTQCLANRRRMQVDAESAFVLAADLLDELLEAMGRETDGWPEAAGHDADILAHSLPNECLDRLCELQSQTEASSDDENLGRLPECVMHCIVRTLQRALLATGAFRCSQLAGEIEESLQPYNPDDEWLDDYETAVRKHVSFFDEWSRKYYSGGTDYLSDLVDEVLDEVPQAKTGPLYDRIQQAAEPAPQINHYTINGNVYTGNAVHIDKSRRTNIGTLPMPADEAERKVAH